LLLSLLVVDECAVVVVVLLARRATSMSKNKKYVVRLTDEERAYLRTLVGRGSAPAAMLTRARILLKTNQGEGGAGWPDAAIADALEVGLSTVARVRQQYVGEGLKPALNRKAPDREYRRKLDGEQEARLIALACSEAPTGRKRWTLRMLADRLVALEVVQSVSHETVRQVLKQTNSSPT
jgi:transposase